MTAHPNAHILAQLAEIAKTDPEPWKRLEVQVGNGWLNCNEFTTPLNPNVAFRIKPATVNIGGVELVSGGFGASLDAAIDAAKGKNHE